MSSQRSTALSLAAAAALALAGLAPFAGTSPEARADLPSGKPFFNDSALVDNALFPIVPGAVKVWLGREGRRRITLVVTHLSETRDFEWDGGTVTCRIVAEHKFVGGELVEQEKKYFAQADDGSVYAWGETEEDDDDDEPEDDETDEEEGGGWVVGQVLPSDPAGTRSVPNPALFMPARPVRGDVWNPQDFGPGLTETFTARRTDVRVRVPAGSFESGLRVGITEPESNGRENVWFAPKVGDVKKTSRNENLRLVASTLRNR